MSPKVKAFNPKIKYKCINDVNLLINVYNFLMNVILSAVKKFLQD